VAVEQDLLTAGAERLGMSADGCFEQALLLKAAVLLPAAPRLPSSPLGRALGSTRGNTPAQKAEWLWGDSLIRFPTQLHEACAIAGGSGVEQREARGRRRAESHFPMALPGHRAARIA